MTSDTAAFLLLCVAAIPCTLFPLVFGLTSPWYRSLIGRALLVKSVGLAMLVDISLAYRIFGAEYQGRDVIRIGVFALITVGAWMQFIAIIRAKRHGLHLLKADGDIAQP